MPRTEQSGKRLARKVRKMADISKEVQDFREAVYGEEVRGSLISLAEKVNTESTAAKEAAVNMAGMAAEAVDNANTAISVANTAIDNARDAEKDIKDAADRGDFTSSIRIGTVTTGDAGSEASVSNSGNDKDAVLDITIPRGEHGASFHMSGSWKPEIDYVNDTKQIDIVTYEGSTYGCRKSHTSIASLVPEEDPECWQCIAKKGDPGSVENIGSVNIPFDPIEKRENISPEDTLGVILGKLEKIITDLKSVAFSGKYSDLTETLENVSDLVNDAGYVTTNTWKANTADSEGYVSAGKENPNKVWGTDEKGNPGWQPAINTDDLKYDTMAGATAEEAGTEGMVPAPGAGQQDAFLQGCGIWKNLGAAAFYNVANNDDITEENFLVDGRRFKALRDDVEKINSALDNIGSGNGNLPVGAYVYVLKTSSISFVDAYGDESNMINALDILRNNPANYDTGFNRIFSVDQSFFIMLNKLDNNFYSGILTSASNPDAIFFSHNNKNLCSLLVPQKT